MKALVKIYIKRISENLMTIEDVPIRWREEVQEALEKANKKGDTNE